MLKKSIIYSERYLVDIGLHVFPTNKYTLIRDQIINNHKFQKTDFLEPVSAAEEDILLVHTKEYYLKLKNNKLSHEEIIKLELPFCKDVFEASCLCCGGTIMCSKRALQSGASIHLGGGFHHAFPDHGEGFCVLNDVAVAIRKIQKEKLAKKIMIIDCDLHQGNGNAFIFQNDKNVFTFSIHQQDNYPFFKPKSNLDVGLHLATDNMYMEALEKNIPETLEEFSPDLVVYIAGADPYKDDQIGGFYLTIEGLFKRDRFIFEHLKNMKIPAAVVLGGGYAVNLEDTVQIHYNTVRAAMMTYEKTK